MRGGTGTEALIAGSAGIALGVVTRIADNQENALAWLGSLIAPWVVVAFALGALSGTWRCAVLWATAAMIVGVAVYYA